MDGRLAVIGLGSIGSMALWQASRLSDSVVGFEAQSPGHARSAVGGDTRLFRMLYRGTPSYYPILERSRRLWARARGRLGSAHSDALRRAVNRNSGRTLSSPPTRNHPVDRSGPRTTEPRSDGRALPPTQPPTRRPGGVRPACWRPADRPSSHRGGHRGAGERGNGTHRSDRRYSGSRRRRGHHLRVRFVEFRERHRLLRRLVPAPHARLPEGGNGHAGGSTCRGSWRARQPSSRRTDSPSSSESPEIARCTGLPASTG